MGNLFGWGESYCRHARLGYGPIGVAAVWPAPIVLRLASSKELEHGTFSAPSRIVSAVKPGEHQQFVGVAPVQAETTTRLFKFQQFSRST